MFENKKKGCGSGSKNAKGCGSGGKNAKRSWALLLLAESTPSLQNRKVAEVRDLSICAGGKLTMPHEKVQLMDMQFSFKLWF